MDSSHNAPASNPTPLPMLQIYCVVFVQITEAININVLFPFMAFMVEDMGYTGNALGYHVGALAASFCAAQFCSSVPWGMISDKYGRRSAIVLGTLGAALGMAVFGSAKVYSQAVLGRLLSGLLSGNLGPLKSFLTEITDDTNRGAGFSYMSLAWSIGCVVAPLAGGLLSRPAEKYPSIFPDRGFFTEFPYLLPCLMCVSWNVFASMFCYFFMVETRTKCAASDAEIEMTTAVTNPIRKQVTEFPTCSNSGNSENEYSSVAVCDRDLAKDVDSFVVRIDSGISDDESALSRSQSSVSSFKVRSLDNDRMESKKLEQLHHTGDVPRESVPVAQWRCFSADYEMKDATEDNYSGVEDGGVDFVGNADNLYEEEEEEIYDEEAQEGEEDCFSSCWRQESQLGVNSSHGLLNDSTDADSVVDIEDKSVATTADNSEEVENRSPKQRGDDTMRVLRQRVVVLSTVNYGMVAAAFILLDETLPLYLKHSVEEGGLSFDSGQIGLLLSISGALMLVFTLFFLPVISRRSKFWMFEFGSSWSIPLAFCWPLVGVLYRTSLSHISAAARISILWSILLVIGLAKNIMACLIFTAVMILLNHAVHDRYLGAVNGMGQSFAALARAVGPAVGGALWSLSSTHHFVFLNFIVVGALMFACLVVNKQLPRSLDFKKVEKPKRRLRKVGSGS